MPRLLIGILGLTALLGAAEPASTPIDTSANKALWDELQLESANKLDYATYQLNTWRFRDSTGALSGLGSIPKGAQFGNYVVVCEGQCPADLGPVVDKLPKLRNGTLPNLITYIPPKGMVPGSQKYVVGPAGLKEFAPSIPTSAAAFQFGTEAALARYKVAGAAGKNEAILAIFAFPTNAMARQQLLEFQKIPGALAKRSGPLVGIAVDAGDETSAKSLLKDLEYQASLSWDETPPLIIRPQTAAQIVLGGLELAGYLMGFCLISGLAYGAFRQLNQRGGTKNAGEAMIVLDLGSK